MVADAMRVKGERGAFVSALFVDPKFPNYIFIFNVVNSQIIDYTGRTIITNKI